MSVEDRLFALAQQCRQQNGDAFLANASQFGPRLNSQAPDLHAEIRALAAAIELGAAARIAAAPDQQAATAQISAEIATRERISISAVAPAIAVARRLGPLQPTAAPTPSPAQWAGDSVAVGAAPVPPQPQAPAYQAPAYQTPAYAAHQAPGAAPYPGAPQPPPAGAQSQTDKLKALTKNPWAMGAAALVLGLLFYQNFMNRGDEIQTAPLVQGQEQAPFNTDNPDGPQPPSNPQQPPNTASQMPVLGQPGAGPTLPVQQHPSGGPAIGFALSTPQGPAPGLVLLPPNGWQAGPVNFGLAQPGDTSGQSFASMGQGQFQLIQSEGHPVRLAQIQMSQDRLGVGNVCIMFRGQQGQQDVGLQGADFCVMDGPCSRPLGCGRLQ